jgi:hypothetical protein
MNQKTGNRITRPVHAGTIAGVLAGIALLVTACGGNSSTVTRSASNSIPDTQANALAYSQCMQSHGDPNFPNPKQGPGGAWLYPMTPQTQQYVSGPAFDTAQRACRKVQPNQGITPAQRRAALDQLLKLARCMRAHGVTGFPDPTSNNGGVGIHISNGIDPSSPQFQAAAKSCRMPGV